MTERGEWEVRGYSTGTQGNDPSPLTDGPFAKLNEVISIEVDSNGNVIIAGIKKQRE